MSISAIPASTFSQSPLSVSNSIYQQGFAQLGQDLTSGNLSAAQKDYSSLQQDIRNAEDPVANRRHHLQHFRSDSSQLTNGNSLQQLLTKLGQDLTSGNLSAAQQAYSAVQMLSTASTVDLRHAIEPPVHTIPLTYRA